MRGLSLSSLASFALIGVTSAITSYPNLFVDPHYFLDKPGWPKNTELAQAAIVQGAEYLASQGPWGESCKCRFQALQLACRISSFSSSNTQLPRTRPTYLLIMILIPITVGLRKDFQLLKTFASLVSAFDVYMYLDMRGPTVLRWGTRRLSLPSKFGTHVPMARIPLYSCFPAFSCAIPVVTLDGQFNPDQHLVNNTGAFMALADAIFYNGVAWRITGTQSYSTEVVTLFTTWFLHPSTYVKPNRTHPYPV